MSDKVAARKPMSKAAEMHAEEPAPLPPAMRRALADLEVRDERRRLDPDDLPGRLQRILHLADAALTANTDSALAPGLELLCWTARQLHSLQRGAVAALAISQGLSAVANAPSLGPRIAPWGGAYEANPEEKAARLRVRVDGAEGRREVLEARHREALAAVRGITGDGTPAEIVDAIFRDATEYSKVTGEVRSHVLRQVHSALDGIGGKPLPGVDATIAKSLAVFERRQRRGRARRGVLKGSNEHDLVAAVNDVLGHYTRIGAVSSSTIEGARKARRATLQQMGILAKKARKTRGKTSRKKAKRSGAKSLNKK
jgi:hypothetical protein